MSDNIQLPPLEGPCERCKRKKATDSNYAGKDCPICRGTGVYLTPAGIQAARIVEKYILPESK